MYTYTHETNEKRGNLGDGFRPHLSLERCFPTPCEVGFKLFVWPLV